MVVHIVHGINLGQLGTRQPEVYGTLRLEDQLPVLQTWLDAHFGGTELRSFQSDDEGALCAYLAAHNGSDHAFVINPGAFTHTSVALRDAVAGLSSPVIEVHLSHTYARESYRKSSLVASECVGTVSGFGWLGYTLGFQALLAQQPA
jgi:3-dehydroquinate dehydratase-2